MPAAAHPQPPATPPEPSPGAPAANAPSFSADAAAAPDRAFAATLARLWQAVSESREGAVPEVVPGEPGDRRFDAAEWHALPWFSWLRQAYLAQAAFLRAKLDATPMRDAERHRARFFLEQAIGAASPANFLATNPAAQKRALASGGASLVRGAANLCEDMRLGRITMSDPDAFVVGRDLAATPGSVVYRNALIELVQYDATTARVSRRPLLVVPPCINKFYVLDLRAQNSFVQYAVAQGHTTFIVSWRNVPPSLGALTYDEYLRMGVLDAVEAVKEITGSGTLDTLGFCVGGTLLSSALAVLAARNDRSAATLTLLATMLDFSDVGEVSAYVTPQFLAATEAAFLAGQRMPAQALAGAFATLRPNDLVWRYVVSNYLEGRTPPPLDFLHWNGDSTNLAGPMFAYYLRNMYLGNRLREPGALTMLGEPVDLSRIRCPAYVLASRADHIVPWKSAWKSTGLLGGDVTFALAASGHIAGVVNPPLPLKRNYWANELLTDDPDDWLAHAESVPGSWWPHWSAWLARHEGASRPAPVHAGSPAHPPLDPAPGRYVLETP